MKQKIFYLVFALANCLIYTLAFSQAPLAIPYQAVARDASGNLIINQNVSLRFSIRNATAAGSVVYSETKNTTSNALGLLNVNIGEGTPLIGTINSIDWSIGAKFIQVELDVAGGTNYVDMGTTQLMSVPYSLFANKVKDLPTNTTNGNTMHWNGITWVADNTIYNNGSNIGIGTISPTEKLHTVGGVRFEELSGVGNRAVLVDANGKLMAAGADSNVIINNPSITPIPDNSCTPGSSTVMVSNYPLVPYHAISVRINITHTYDADLRIYLKSPSGLYLNLAYADGGSGDNFTNTVFVSNAAGPLSSGMPPFTGTYVPTANTSSPPCGLSSAAMVTGFNGLGGYMIDPNGNWELIVYDVNGSDAGSIVGFDLMIDLATTQNNKIPKWQNGQLVQSNIISIGGKTGIGTLFPQAMFEVSEDALIGGAQIGTGKNGFYNTRLGYGAFNNNASGTSNTAVGYNAANSNQIGSNNSALGLNALANNSSGNDNTAIGCNAANYVYGSGNTYVGSSAGTMPVLLLNPTNYNTFIGYNTGTSGGSYNYSTALGAGATVTQNNTTIIGGLNGSQFATNVGLGLSNPGDKLDVNGAIRAQSGYRCKAGTNFGFGTNIYNFHWTNGSQLQCWIDGTLVGTVSGLSDRRLKDQISPMKNEAISRVMKLNPVSFHYKNVEGTIFKENLQIQEGFIADELQEVIPSAVIGEKDAVTDDGKIQPQSLNIIPVVSLLTKAVQEINSNNQHIISQVEALQKQNELLQKQLDELKLMIKK